MIDINNTDQPTKRETKYEFDLQMKVTGLVFNVVLLLAT